MMKLRVEDSLVLGRQIGGDARLETRRCHRTRQLREIAIRVVVVIVERATRASTGHAVQVALS